MEDTTSVFHKDVNVYTPAQQKGKIVKKGSTLPTYLHFSNINLGLQYVNKYT